MDYRYVVFFLIFREIRYYSRKVVIFQVFIFVRFISDWEGFQVIRFVYELQLELLVDEIIGKIGLGLVWVNSW